MKTLRLEIKDISPFNEGHLAVTNHKDGYGPVSIITGENGTLTKS